MRTTPTQDELERFRLRREAMTPSTQPPTSTLSGNDKFKSIGSSSAPVSNEEAQREVEAFRQRAQANFDPNDLKDPVRRPPPDSITMMTTLAGLAVGIPVYAVYQFGKQAYEMSRTIGDTAKGQGKYAVGPRHFATEEGKEELGQRAFGMATVPMGGGPGMASGIRHQTFTTGGKGTTIKSAQSRSILGEFSPDKIEAFRQQFSALPIAKRMDLIASGRLMPIESLNTEQLVAVAEGVRKAYTTNPRELAEATSLYGKLQNGTMTQKELDRWLELDFGTIRYHAGNLYEMAVDPGKYIDKMTTGIVVTPPKSKMPPNDTTLGAGTKETSTALRALSTLEKHKDATTPRTYKRFKETLTEGGFPLLDKDFVPTTPHLSQVMLDRASEGRSLGATLEPHGGSGAIVNEIKARGGKPTVLELNAERAEMIGAINEDFLNHKGRYDTITMNPPFSGSQFILHVLHGYEMLKRGGRLVAIVPERGVITGLNRMPNDLFAKWLKTIPANSRVIRRTNMPTRDGRSVKVQVISIDKPMEEVLPRQGDEATSTLLRALQSEKFYSPLERALETGQVGKLTLGENPKASGVLSTMKFAMDKNIINREELDYTGLLKKLIELGDQRVSRKELLDFVKQRSLKETGEPSVLGGTTVDPTKIKFERTSGQFEDESGSVHPVYKFYHNGEFIGTSWMSDPSDAPGIVRSLIDMDKRSVYGPESGYSSNINLPGAIPGTYQERLFHFTPEGATPAKTVYELMDSTTNKHMSHTFDTAEEAYKAGEDLRKAWGMQMTVVPKTIPAKGGLHYVEPHDWPGNVAENAFLFTRGHDRKLPGGETVKHIDEAQSSLHQAAEKEGYAKLDDVPEFDRIDKQMEVVRQQYENLDWDQRTQPQGEALRQQMSDLVDEMLRLKDPSNRGIPKAPFSDLKWAKLGLKEWVDTAIREGKDGVSWNVGKTVADRYNHFAEEFTWRKNLNSGEYDLEFRTPNGRTMHVVADSLKELESKTTVNVAKIVREQEQKADIPPREMFSARKQGDNYYLVDNTTKEIIEEYQRDGVLAKLRADQYNNKPRMISGPGASGDFLVGGKFFERVYDEYMVREAEKEYGVRPRKVKTSILDSNTRRFEREDFVIEQAPDRTWRIVDATPQRHGVVEAGGYLSYNDAMIGLSAFLKEGKSRLGAVEKEIWYLPFNDALKQRILSQGQRIAVGSTDVATALRGLSAQDETTKQSQPPTDHDSRPPYETGKASWYGKEFHGKKMSNKQKYNMNKMTAAHRRLPFGTKVRVTDKETGKNVVVEVTDRGPYKYEGRAIDLSRAAARKLGIEKKGLANVRIEVIEKAKENPPSIRVSER